MAPNGTDTSVITLPTPNNSNNLKSMDTVDAPPATTSASQVEPPPQQPQRSNNKNWHPLNMKRESDRRKTYESWPITFMDPHRLSAAGFYYTDQNDVVRCAFCGVEVGRWEEGDDPFRDHQRWAPSCGFVRGLPVGNIPISPNGQPESSTSGMNLSRDVCGPFLEIRPNAGPERGMSNGVHQALLTAEELRKHGIHQSRGPDHPTFNTYEARMQSFEGWPKSLKQKPDKLSEAGFYYTGKGDQTVCFHCGGGLKDWEENDDPWVEHALWFPKCIHVILIKGHKFIEDVRQLKKAKQPIQDIPETPMSATQSTPSTSATEQTPNSEEKVIDDARICQICFQEERGVLFLPCGHIVACVKCAPSLSTCAVCRQPFSGTVRAFLS